MNTTMDPSSPAGTSSPEKKAKSRWIFLLGKKFVQGGKSLALSCMKWGLLVVVLVLLWRSSSVRARVKKSFPDFFKQPESSNMMLDSIHSKLSDFDNSLDRVRKLAAQVQPDFRGATTPIHLPGRPAELRVMPYPFHTYFSINSDPDSMTTGDFFKIHELINGQYQLPLSDQVFIGTRAKKGMVDCALKENHAEPQSWRLFHHFLVAYNRGWIEGIHGWHDWAVASSDSAIRLEAKPGREVTQTNAKLSADHSDSDFRCVVFDYRMPKLSGFVKVKAGEKELLVRNTCDKNAGIDAAIAWTSVFAVMPAGATPEITFEIVGNEGDVFEARNVMVCNLSRHRAQLEAKFLSGYNALFLYYSEHGRLRNELATGSRIDFQNETRPHALLDYPEGNLNTYIMDCLEMLGVQFLNPMHHTAQLEVLPIDQAVKMHRFNDGVVRYMLPRFFATPLDADNKPHPVKSNISWEPWLGFHMEKVLARSNQFGKGAVIYTHWGCANPKDGVLSPGTLQQLAHLQDRYYNLSGTQKTWDRTWVAPTCEIAMYSRALQGVEGNATYEEASNAVHMRSWFDPVSRQWINGRSGRAFGLANLTFYVRDSATARLFLDGQEYTCFRRNPADQTGKQSITLVDDSLPSVVFDEVDPIQKFGDADSEDAECYFRRSGGFKGRNCMEVVAQGVKGSTTWKLPGITSANTTHFRFAYKKSNGKSRVALRLIFADGSEALATEGELAGEEIGWKLSAAAEGEWRDVVLHLVDLQHSKALKCVPQGKLESFRVELDQAEEGDQVFIDAVEFLRNPCHPLPATRLMMIAGKVDPPQDNVKIVLENGKSKSTTTTKEGCFFFPEAVEKGSVIKLYAVPADGAARYPTNGRYLEIHKNEVELRIPLADGRNLDPKHLEKVYKGKSEYIPEVGLIYEPRCEFVNSGLSVPQEFMNRLQVNNMGFLDRDRRFENPDRARRVLCMGTCNLFGHSVQRSFHTNLVMEGILNSQMEYPVEVMTLGNSAYSFGKYWPYYQSFGKKFHPEVVVVFIHSGVDLMETHPDIMAKCYEYDPNHLPSNAFRSKSDGTLEIALGDPEYYQFAGKNEPLKKQRETEKKKSYYYVEGVDWNNVFYHKSETLPQPAQEVWDHFVRILTFYRDEMAKNNSRLIIVMTPEYQMTGLGGANKEFKDIDGTPCNSDMFPKRFARICQKLNIGFVNTADHIEKNYREGQKMASWKRDSHASMYGFEWVGESVSAYLIQTNFMRNLPGTDPRELEEYADRQPRHRQ